MARLKEIAARRKAGEGLDEIRAAAVVAGSFGARLSSSSPRKTAARVIAGAPAPESILRLAPLPGVEILISDVALKRAGCKDTIAPQAGLAAALRKLGF